MRLLLWDDPWEPLDNPTGTIKRQTSASVAPIGPPEPRCSHCGSSKLEYLTQGKLLAVYRCTACERAIGLSR